MERHQFQVLYRQFLLRVVDLELLSAQGDPTKLLGQFATVLLTFSILVSVPVLFMGLGARRISPEGGWTFEHFLIATTMVVVGLFSVLSWDSAFPDRRDVLILAPLPVRARTLFLAKLAALGAGLSLSIFALNGASGLLYPLFFTPANSRFLSVFRSLAAYWLTIVAAAAFLFGSVLTIQGVASKILRRQLFLKVSALLQVLTFCLFLSVYVLEPSLEARAALVAPENQTLLASLPSYWFLGLFQQLNGSMEPAFIPLARRAWIALAISALGTVASILLSYLHTLRGIVEEPDILPSSRRSHGPPSITSSVDNAVLLFSLRTLLRSQQHRLILSLYLGVGFAVMLILLRPALGNGAATAGALLSVSILMLCVAAVAVRTVFSMPIMLRANWLFRVAALHPVATYSKAVRRSFLLLAVAPVWAAFAALFFSIWPWKIAAAYLVALGLVGSILADLCMHGFHKIPFSCSYQPGKANIQFAFWGFLVLLPFTRMAANHAWKTLQHPSGRASIIVSLGALAMAARWRARRAAKLADAMQFEEVDEPQLVSLELSTDGVLLRNSLLQPGYYNRVTDRTYPIPAQQPGDRQDVRHE